jgi:multiple sugar transport system substrate-binding protein
MAFSKIFRGALTPLVIVALLFASGCGGPTDAERAAAEPVTITVWRVFDDDSTLRDAMAAYRELHKNVSFEYRTLRYEEYQDELLRAFAEGTGPDVFSLHNTWIGQYESLILPLPKTLAIPFTETRGTIKKETVTTIREEPSMTVREMETAFVDAVADDLVRDYRPNPKQEAEKRIFGIPYSVDTLALFYNKELYNAAGVTTPPATWTDFQAATEKLTTVGANDALLQSGAALGTSRNVERAFDVLSLLMMQNGTPMADERGNATFSRELDDKSLPGADALRFYVEFSNPLKSVYSWNAEQPSSFDAFVSGKTAMFLGYAYHLPLIRARAPKLDFGVAPVPQISEGRTVNYANYWVETVSQATEHKDWAWDFIQFAAGADQVDAYLKKAGKPTALRGLIGEQLVDDDLAVFAGQLLTAKSWYTGDDAAAAEGAFLDLVDAAVAGGELDRLIRDAQNKVNQTL